MTARMDLDIRALLLRHGRGARAATGPAVRFLERNELDERAGRAVSDEELTAIGASPEIWEGEGRLDDGRAVRTWLHMAVLELTEGDREAEEEALERRRARLRKPSIGTV